MRRPLLAGPFLSGLGLAACLALSAQDAEGGNRFAYVPAAVEMTRAVQYATMSAALCLLELDERGVPFEQLDSATSSKVRGVETPIRLTGAIRGVSYVPSWRPGIAGTPRTPGSAGTPRTPGNEHEPPPAILDCALALALDDLSSVLAAHDVVLVQYLSMYRPGAARPGVRHPSGRAIDVEVITTAAGEELSVNRDFYGRVGKQTCGVGAARPRRDVAAARLWREIVCELDAMQSFNLLLTPNYDWGHRDHLHLEVRSGVRWFLTQ